jgi:hypothetical protein
MAFSSSLNISRLDFFLDCSFFLPGRSGREDSAAARFASAIAASSRAFLRLVKDSASSASLLVGL